MGKGFQAMGAATFLTISSNFMPSSSRSSLQCRTSTIFDGASDDNAADGQQTINEQATTDSTCKKTTCPPGIIDDSIQENGQTVRHEQGPRKLEKLARQCRSFIYKQATATDNRYALQVSIAFLVAAMAVIIQPVSNLAPNAFWVGTYSAYPDDMQCRSVMDCKYSLLHCRCLSGNCYG